MGIGRGARLEGRNDFLATLEENIRELDMDGTPIGPNREGSLGKRVTFSNSIRKRRFDKNRSVLEFENEEGLPKMYDSNKENNEDSNDSLSEDYDTVHFDSLSPSEQLKMLMEPVDDEEEVVRSGDEDEDEYEYENKGDGNDDDDYNGGFGSKDYNLEERENHSQERFSKKLQLSLDDDDDDSVEEPKKPRSSFEKQQEKLRTIISEFEKESVSEKPWMLKGEVSAKHRPTNSLLEHDLDFEHVSRAPPIITEEVTESIEAIIKQRIRDRAWDDVERTMPTIQVANIKKKPELDMEKSKKSLSEIYEDRTTTVSTPLTGEIAKPVDKTTQKAHDEITNLFAKICQKIDSLSRYKFAPRAYVCDEIDLKSIKRKKDHVHLSNKN